MIIHPLHKLLLSLDDETSSFACKDILLELEILFIIFSTSFFHYLLF